MGWTRRAPPQPAASGGVLSSPGLFGVPRSAKYAGLPPLDHPARGHSPDEIRRLAARAASPRCRSSSGNSLCGQNSAGFRESARPFKGIVFDDISEFESYMASHAVRCSGFSMTATRATWGAASLSTSSDFTATLSGGCAAGCGPRQGRLALRPP